MLRSRESFTARIALTMGDPCGVGPEILVKALAGRERCGKCALLLIGDPLALIRASDLLKQDITFQTVKDIARFKLDDSLESVMLYTPFPLSEEDMEYGTPSGKTCHAVIRYIECAARLALDGNVDAICTCPVNKANLQRHSFPFPGHTEFLQELTQTRDVVMMLAGPRLRVALVTIHNAISQVPGLINRERIARTISITADALRRDFGIQKPRIAVAGLNPHAGEDGRFGNEEIDVIRPVVNSFAGSSFHLLGPLPPDTVFHRAYEGEFDAVIAMYHDQGLIPIKLVHFMDAVNITLGMPIVRTSVDHGTAYDLAGTGKAHEGSLLAAIRCAAAIAENRLKVACAPR
ncbi:MAG: 4-hydroxythreonine-4-phosphate dehydrogenase PdxA [Deltaproteobacteria bacterium]|nr:4-hydroxythreonine-4-phosphate dehydrogenase PdxA [Deltaproteobacteria bacterium]